MSLPLILAGPILRRVTPELFSVWLVSKERLAGSVQIRQDDEEITHFDLSFADQIQVGERAWVVMVSIPTVLPQNTVLTYDIYTQEGTLSDIQPEIAESNGIEFQCSTRADYVLHGSCRHPHSNCEDALVAAADQVSQQTVLSRPTLLMMSGDQIYADHVAGPMLFAIFKVIKLLGLKGEHLPACRFEHSDELQGSDIPFYQRDTLWPHHEVSRFFDLRKTHEPIISSVDSDNHVMSLNEFIAMYLLTWSPVLWQEIGDLDNTLNADVMSPDASSTQHNNDKRQRHRKARSGVNANVDVNDHSLKVTWQKELESLKRFAAGMERVQWLLARIPTYMMFDDHDVTDDWNLTVGWEEAVYGHPLTRQMIGNGLISYWLFQGWGNNPTQFDANFKETVANLFRGASNSLVNHEDALQQMLAYQGWQYTVDTSPRLVVLDTRTRRWRSESRFNKPSGLMDWEALVEFQQAIINQPSVIIVSAAPMFGVKFIETLQRVMTWGGYPLVVDAENWMTHRGAANTLISIFTHTKTPQNFVILSGDVHYSFAYDIKLRSRRSRPTIYQVTCSGLRNTFPEPLLTICETSDRVLYSPNSPLNWFTKRKRLKIFKRDPDTAGHQRVVNQSAVGELRLDEQGAPKDISVLTAKGTRIRFPSIKK